MTQSMTNRKENQSSRTTIAETIGKGSKVDSSERPTAPIPPENRGEGSRKVLLKTPIVFPQANNTGSNQGQKKITKIIPRKSGSSKGSNDPTNDDYKSNRYSSRKCFIVHDPFLRHFNPEKFSSWFDTTSLQYRTTKDILREGTLVSKVKARKPEVVFIHTGFGDLLDKTTAGEDLLDNYKQLVYNLLENTTTRVCISTMIPVTGYPQLNSKLRQINTLISEFISQLRKQQKYKNRVYTTNNDSLGGYIDRSTGSNGVSIVLSERGKKLFVLRVKDSLQRSLGIIPDRPRSESHDNTRNNKYNE